MKPRYDFYTVAAPVAFIVGFAWVYASMVFLKIPGWPAMVGMAGYYAVGGMDCHVKQRNASRSLKGLLLGAIVSWLAVAVWTVSFKGNPLAMGLAMGVIVVIVVLATKIKLGDDFPFIAMPQAFLGATIFFGLFNTFMMAGGAPKGLLFGSLQSFAIKGAAQPHIAGAVAVGSCIIGVLLGVVHQNISLYMSRRTGEAKNG
ncbi:MAG: DUF1097 domain-containing protein [Alphaproteobacteria bacterium]